MPDRAPIPFTYFGDMLGVSSFYKLGGTMAKDRLSEFYNETFSVLNPLVNPNSFKVFMWSDSLFVTGDDALSAIESIGLLYGNLLRKGLLLRGAMVKGRLTFEPRFTIKGFDKNLPIDDTLACAAGLEKSQKGARFVLEPELVHKLVETYAPERKDWLSLDGYTRTGMNRGNDWLRKITPTPDEAAFEYHHYWSLGVEKSEFDHRISALKAVESMVDGPGKEQYEQTRKLIERTKLRFSEHC